MAFRWLNGGVTNEVYTPMTLPPKKKGMARYGVIGSPIAHSLSPVMQLAGWEKLGVQAEYFRIEIPAGGLEGAVPQLLRAGLDGWNCTLPHKGEMFRFSEVRSPSALQAQSVNTVQVVQGKIHGSSTDAEGWSRAMREIWPDSIPPKRTLLLGCGGVGQTIARFLASIGCTTLTLINRDSQRAEKLHGELTQLGGNRFPLRVLDWNMPNVKLALSESDLLIQATSLGLQDEDPLPIPIELLNPPLQVYDTIYRKGETSLVRVARQRGCQAEDGLGMLLHQGALSLELWSGQPAPLSTMRQALYQAAGRDL